MVFVSIEFLILLLSALIMIAISPRRIRSWIMVITSYIFYGWWDYRFLGLLLVSSTIDFICGLLADPERTTDERVRRVGLVTSIVANLSILGFFKYFDFFIGALNSSAFRFGIANEEILPLMGIVLPVGISFYTFQSMSYTIDVYRGDLRSTLNVGDFLAYVSFFPQLVAGPIERGSQLLPQISKGFVVAVENLPRALPLLLVGVFKKLVIADNAGLVVNSVFTAQDPGALDVWIGGYAFAFQIWGDFSAYTDIARGTALLFGIELMENFRAPYLASNPREFWRRWHISLSTWFRDYLYIPLGGNRCGRAKTYRNLCITMFLCGLWHGAVLNFVVWGVFHGALFFLFRLTSKQEANRSLVSQVLSVVLFFQVTTLGWIIFRSSNGNLEFLWVLGQLCHLDGIMVLSSIQLLKILIIGFAVFAIQGAVQHARSSEFYREWSTAPRLVMHVVLMWAICNLIAGHTPPFIYFQF